MFSSLISNFKYDGVLPISYKIKTVEISHLISLHENTATLKIACMVYYEYKDYRSKP